MAATTPRPWTSSASRSTCPKGAGCGSRLHQRFSDGAGALSDVFLDGARVVQSTEPNMFGRPIERVRFGLVAAAAPKQKLALSLCFDRTVITTRQTGPIAAAAAATVLPAQRRSALTPAQVGKGCGL